MMKRILMYGFTLSAIAACTTASVRVLPGEGDVNSVVSRDIEREGAEEAAVDAANEFCKERGQVAVFVNNDTQYTGQIDEGTRNIVRNASAAVWMLGKPGSVASDAGSAGRMMTSDRDYKSEIKFKCK